MKNVSRFKYATWDVRGLGQKEEEEELDRFLNENNVKISVITGGKKELQGTKETEHYKVIYSGVGRHIRGQSGDMIWIHKSISNKIDHYKFWNDGGIETRLKTLNNISSIWPNEGREELSEEFYEKLQKILDKVKRNDYIILTGDMRDRVGNNRLTNIVGTNGEAALNSNGRKLITIGNNYLVRRYKLFSEM